MARVTISKSSKTRTAGVAKTSGKSKRKATNAKSPRASAKASTKTTKTHRSRSNRSIQANVLRTVKGFVKEHNIEEAVKSAMKAMIDQIKL